jgi:hypothetical protein
MPAGRGVSGRGSHVVFRPNSNGGRSYGNVLGHFHELFSREEFRRVLVNGILWNMQLKGN